jgi:hypothetical protein
MGSNLLVRGGSQPATSMFARALTAAGAGAVLRPEETRFAKAMGRLFSSEASLTQPVCIVQPKDRDQVAAAIHVARDFGYPVTVRGGSHSSLCAGDQALMIDLSAHFDQVVLKGDEAQLGGGVTMGRVLASLGSQARLIPVGVARTPGMGLALQGGVGYLTRSLGLTLDSIRLVELVTPGGEVLELSDRSSGAEADLWWGVRGCAPNLGVVTSMTVGTFPATNQVFARRLLLPLDALSAYFELAPALPRNISASVVLGPPAGGAGEPVLFMYIVYAGDDAEGIHCIQEFVNELISRSGMAPFLEHGQHHPYFDMPPMDIPALAGFPSETPPEIPATNPRVFTFKKSPFLKSLDAAAAAGLMKAIRTAPTPLCRIDFQQCGGALTDCPPTSSAFWNRNFEWNCPVIGGWIGGEDDRTACTAWVRQTVKFLVPYTLGTYSVEITPGLPETVQEVEQAFGGNLPRLRMLKRKWDPESLFRLYYPI